MLRETDDKRRSISPASPPAMSYESALQQAKKDAGYRRYGRLTASQKSRVREEAAKYNPRPPKEPVAPAMRDRQKQNRGAINPYTGEYYAPSGSGYVGTRDGTYYAPAGPNGVVNTRTGEFIPAH